MAKVRLTKISNLIIIHCHDHSSFIGKECENEPLQDNMSVNLPHKKLQQLSKSRKRSFQQLMEELPVSVATMKESPVAEEEQECT